MFNIKEPAFNNCTNHSLDDPVYTGYPCYIYSVKWCDFVNEKTEYLDAAERIRDRIGDYDITKTVSE